MSNHRNRIKSLQPQPLYKHLNSDGHSQDDLTIQPIEEVVLEPGDKMSLHSKWLSRENFWMRELKTIQPYGLNDNVRSVGNISKLPEEPAVWIFSIDTPELGNINPDTNIEVITLLGMTPYNGCYSKLVTTNPGVSLKPTPAAYSLVKPVLLKASCPLLMTSFPLMMFPNTFYS